MDRLAGDVTGRRRRQEQHGPGDVRDGAGPPVGGLGGRSAWRAAGWSSRRGRTRCLVTPGAVTQRVDRAIESGLVVRMPAADQSRSVFVELTKRRQRVVSDAVRNLLSYEQALVDHLTPAEQEQVALFLAALASGLVSRRFAAGPVAPAVPASACGGTGRPASWERYAWARLAQSLGHGRIAQR